MGAACCSFSSGLTIRLVSSGSHPASVCHPLSGVNNGTLHLYDHPPVLLLLLFAA